MTTTLSRRILLRAAGRIHDQYTRLHRPPDLPLLPFAAWDACVRLAVHIERAQERGFQATAERLSRQLVRELDACSQRCRETAAVIQTADRCPAVPSLRLIYDELAALPQEFDHVEIDLTEGELVVTTGPIVLEGINLGPFEIRFDWNDLEESQPYRVIALQPYAASSDSETPHPHVRGEWLCEGEARHALDDALVDGRLGDYFLIVAQTLNNYNPGSAYVSLDDWDGVRCIDCGDTVDSDDVSYCERCSTACCSECCRYCEQCGHVYCSDCIDRCGMCDETFCNRCLCPCAVCRSLHCPGCLTDDRCEECVPASDPETVPEPASQPTTKEPPDADPKTTPAATPAATVRPSPPQTSPNPSAAPVAVHADRLGQAAAPA